MILGRPRLLAADDDVVVDIDQEMDGKVGVVDPAKVTVEDAMVTDVYAVSPDAPLDEAAVTAALEEAGDYTLV